MINRPPTIMMDKTGLRVLLTEITRSSCLWAMVGSKRTSAAKPKIRTPTSIKRTGNCPERCQLRARVAIPMATAPTSGGAAAGSGTTLLPRPAPCAPFPLGGIISHQTGSRQGSWKGVNRSVMARRGGSSRSLRPLHTLPGGASLGSHRGAQRLCRGFPGQPSRLKGTNNGHLHAHNADI
jgi:hypothetical protein